MTKKTAFTLIELLVVIVIIGILTTISTATFQQYLQGANDTKRINSVRDVSSLFLNNGVFRAGNGDGFVYTYGPEAMESALEEQGISTPNIDNNICYAIDSINDLEEFFVMTWGVTTSTANPGTPGPIYNGSLNMKAKLKFLSDTGAISESDFHCLDSDMIAITLIARPAINGIPAFTTLGNRLRTDQTGRFCNFSGSYNESTELCDF